MVKKAVLAQFIRAGRHEFVEWCNFMPTIKGLRVKDVGSRGDVMISMDDKGWFSPESWLANYQAEVRERLAEELKTAGATLSTEMVSELVLPYVDSTKLTFITEQEKDFFLQLAMNNGRSQPQRLFDGMVYLCSLLNESDLAINFVDLTKTHPMFKSNS